MLFCQLQCSFNSPSLNTANILQLTNLLKKTVKLLLRYDNKRDNNLKTDIKIGTGENYHLIRSTITIETRTKTN